MNFIEVQGKRFEMELTNRASQMETVDDFWMSQYTVTQQLWEEIMDNNPSVYKGSQIPVTNISWDEAQEFLSKLNNLFELEGNKGFRLPKEVEWQFAAMGGKYSKYSKYAGAYWPNKVAWYWKNRTPIVYVYKGPQAVGIKLPNELGIFDMSGNVSEWCSDAIVGNYDGNSRGYRGGSWDSDNARCKVSYVRSTFKSTKDKSIGFRLVASNLS